MSSTSVQLAWAMPVNPVTLAAHLGVQVKLQSCIDTIRLCNRFGKGELAAITKLPIELVHRVEDFLLVAARRRQRNGAASEYKCWTGRCRPTDHIDEIDSICIYNDMFGHEIDDEADELTAEETHHLNELIRNNDDPHDYPNGIGGWLNNHALVIEKWHKRTGYPGSHHRGLSTKHAAFLKKNYGLELWTSHMQQKPTDSPPPYTTPHATVTYLTFPTRKSAKACKALTKEDTAPQCDCDECHNTVPVETGLMVPVAIPRKPSEASLGRFPRALKMLDLEAVLPEASGVVLEAMDGDIEADDGARTGEDERGEEHTSRWPKLMLLTRSSMDRE